MYKRKLKALEYPGCQNLNISDSLQIKKLVVWLEDQKIRHYRIENRAKLKDIESSAWDKTFQDYLKDLQYPFTYEDRGEIIEWLLGLAVRLQFGDDVQVYQDVSGKAVQAKRHSSATSPINNIKDSDPKFKEAVRTLAKILNIPLHENDKLTLEAVVLLVEERLSEKGLANYKKKSTKFAPLNGVGRIHLILSAMARTHLATSLNSGVLRLQTKNSVPWKQQELGFDTGDETLNNAARALRLLHINDLRQLQTDINNAVVSVQSITANPKTDQRLGKVGRG